MLIHTRSLVNQLENCLFSIPCMDLSQLCLGLEERKWPIKDQEKMTTWKTLACIILQALCFKTDLRRKLTYLIRGLCSFLILTHSITRRKVRNDLKYTAKGGKTVVPFKDPPFWNRFQGREASSWCSLPRAKAQRWHHGCNAHIELTDCADHVNTYVSSLFFFSQQ